MFRTAIGLTFLLVLGACNGGDDDDDTTDDETESQVFECGYDSCDASAGQFCLMEYYPNGEFSTARCMDVACGDCDCAESATYEYFDGASNCDAMIACSQSDAQITVECTNAPM